MLSLPVTKRMPKLMISPVHARPFCEEANMNVRRCGPDFFNFGTPLNFTRPYLIPIITLLKIAATIFNKGVILNATFVL